MEVFFGLCNLLSWCDFFDQEQNFFLLRLKLDFSNSDFFDLYKLEPHPLRVIPFHNPYFTIFLKRFFRLVYLRRNRLFAGILRKTQQSELPFQRIFDFQKIMS